MDKDIKDKWVAALRSGEYKQGTGQLYNAKKDCYCALGVLCAEAGLKKGSNGGFFLKTHHKRTTKKTIPNNLREKLGISWYDAEDVMTLNDGDEASFPEIADFVEQHL